MAISFPKGSDSSISPRTKTPRILSVVSAALLLASCISVTEDPAGPAPEEPTSVVELIPEEEDVYTAMSEAMLLGNVDEAISAFEDAYSKEPEDAETQILYANLLMAAGEIEEAKLVLQEVLRTEPENTEALYNLSLVEGMAGNKERQEEILISIVAIDPEYIQAHASLGELRLSSGQYGPAKESFEKALSLDAENLMALMGYGNVLLRDDEAGLAAEQFDKVIEQAPDYVFAYVDRSRARKDEGNYQGAEADLGEAIKLEPGYYWHYIDRGRLRLLSMGNPESALEDFIHAIDIDPDFFYAYVFRGGVHDQAGDNPRAIEDYLKVLAARPDYHHLYAPVSVLLYSEERFREARKYLKMAYEYSPDEHFFAFLIALSFRKEGLESDMETYLKRAIVNFPRESLYYRLARIFFETGSDGYVTGEVSREQNLDLKLKALFILATHNLLENRPVLAQKYFLEVEDKAFSSSYERRLSSMELERFRGKGSE